MHHSSLSFHRTVVVVCVIAFLMQTLSPEVTELLALYGPAVATGEWWRLLTVGFMHLNLIHLVMNSISLFVLGSLMEPLFAAGGRWRFPVLYLGSLLGGSLGALLLEFNTEVVGASGAVFGVMGAAIALPLRCGFGANRFRIIPWVVINLLITFSLPNISAGGHLGGLVAGFLLGWALTPLDRLEDTRSPAWHDRARAKRPR